MNVRRTQLLNINFLACSKAEDIESMLQNVNLS